MWKFENLLRKGKPSPRFVCMFEVLERVGTLAYKVALPLYLSKIHNVFYVSIDLEEICFRCFSCCGIGAYLDF